MACFIADVVDADVSVDATIAIFIELGSVAFCIAEAVSVMISVVVAVDAAVAVVSAIAVDISATVAVEVAVAVAEYPLSNAKEGQTMMGRL